VSQKKQATLIFDITSPSVEIFLQVVHTHTRASVTIQNNLVLV